MCVLRPHKENSTNNMLNKQMLILNDASNLASLALRRGMLRIVYCCLLSRRHFANIPLKKFKEKKNSRGEGGKIKQHFISHSGQELLVSRCQFVQIGFDQTFSLDSVWGHGPPVELLSRVTSCPQGE